MKRISDNNIRLVFTPSLECRRDHGAPTRYRNPNEFERNIPCCVYCGAPHKFSHTEIKERTVTVHVRGGVAYGPSRSTNGVTVKVVDHDTR